MNTKKDISGTPPDRGKTGRGSRAAGGTRPAVPFTLVTTDTAPSAGAPETRPEARPETRSGTPSEPRAETQTDYLSYISDEVRSPLDAIIGYSDMIQAPDLDRETLRGYAREIGGMASDLHRLIDELLCMTIIDKAPDPADERTFSLVKLGQDCRRDILRQARAKGLRLPPIAAEDAVCVRGDPRLAKRALLNILANAVAYCTSGAICITVGRGDGRDDGATLRIEDSGPGIAADKLDRLRRVPADVPALQRLHTTGQGLGLPLAGIIMARHQGHLDIRSTPGGGTTVVMAFPTGRTSPDDSFI